MAKTQVRRFTKRPQVDKQHAARLLERRRQRATLQVQRDIERGARSLVGSILRGKTAVSELVYEYARTYGFRITTRDQRHEEERELDALRAELGKAREYIAVLEEEIHPGELNKARDAAPSETQLAENAALVEE